MQQPVGAESKTSGLYIIERIAWYHGHTTCDIKQTKIPIKKKVSHTLQNAKDAELKEPCKAYANPYLERGKHNE